MQKTFLKFILFELLERVLRFRLLLNECVETFHDAAPALKQALLAEAEQLESSLLSHKAQFNKLFADSAKSTVSDLQGVVTESYQRLQALSRMVLQLGQFEVESETYLFLKDALPADTVKGIGEQTVVLTAENAIDTLVPLSGVLFDALSILQKSNPLAWVGLTRAYSEHQVQHLATLEPIKQELKKADKKRGKELTALTDEQLEQFLQDALNVRLLGPAYYFQALSDAVLQQNSLFIQVIEPALFFGLNHQNFVHKSLVILHEACEKHRESLNAQWQAFSEDVLSVVFRAIEKAIPGKMAFQEKHFERAIQLQERLNDGVLLSSTPHYSVAEVDDVLREKRDTADFSIYEPLGMMTEYPHSPREIINAGWLHKMERAPIWLYSALNEENGDGFERVRGLVSYQDHLLRKSIEVSEVHRILLCNA